MHKLAYFIKNKYINKLKVESLKLKAKTEGGKTGVIFSLFEAVDGGGERTSGFARGYSDSAFLRLIRCLFYISYVI